MDVRFEDEIVAARLAPLRFLKRGGRGDPAENVEQRGISGDLQVEVQKTMDKDSRATEDRGYGQRAIGCFGPIF